MTDLSPVIADLRARIGQLPTLTHCGDSAEWIERHRQHREAARHLGEYLTATYGARIHERPAANRIRMLGIAASSTSGLIGAFNNWIGAAERQMGRRCA